MWRPGAQCVWRVCVYVWGASASWLDVAAIPIVTYGSRVRRRVAIGVAVRVCM